MKKNLQVTAWICFALILLAACQKESLAPILKPAPPSVGKTRKAVDTAVVDTAVVETSPPVQTPEYISINANIGGFYQSLPANYQTSLQSCPLMIFCHRLGELGDGSPSQLPIVLRNGPPRLINNKTFPASFTVNGKTFSFIVISPQFRSWPQPADIQATIDYAIAHYRVDTTRIYLTGLSMGGGHLGISGSCSAICRQAGSHCTGSRCRLSGVFQDKTHFRNRSGYLGTSEPV